MSRPNDVGSAVLAAMVLLPQGEMVPFFPRAQDAKAPVTVEAFRLDSLPVTNRDYAAFVLAHPEWRRSQVKPVFADPHYLERWRNDLRWPKGQSGGQPVTNVSWFAAQAYCAARSASLPTTDQWEYALDDAGRNEAARREAILAWYSHPNRSVLPETRHLAANGYGIRGLVGGAWEWTEDFNGATSGEELRAAGKDRNLFCGGASLTAKDAADYAAFMRYSMRLSLKATYATDNLGFRCAAQVGP